MDCTRIEMSLRDVEPVKGFIRRVVELRDQVGVESPVARELDDALSALGRGFGASRALSGKERNGWRIPGGEGREICRRTAERLDTEGWPAVEIIVPVFNSPDLLRACLSSLQRTEYPGRVTLTLVDNASTDPETLEILAGEGIRLGAGQTGSAVETNVSKDFSSPPAGEGQGEGEKGGDAAMWMHNAERVTPHPDPLPQGEREYSGAFRVGSSCVYSSARTGIRGRTMRFGEPVSFSKAVNSAMRESLARYFVLFNQDCEVVEAGWLKYLIAWLEARPNCAVAGAKLLYPEGRIQHAGIEMRRGTCGSHRYLGAPADLKAASFYEKMPAVTGAVFAIRASVVGEIGGLDEGYMFGCEDTEFCLRAGIHGREVWYVPDSVVVHRDNGVRKTNPEDSERIRRWVRSSNRKFQREWGGFTELCDGGRVAIVLPDLNPVAGGCRVAAAIANSFVNAGLETTVYTYTGECKTDKDCPRYFNILPLSDLERDSSPDVLIATRFDTVLRTARIPAKRKIYLIQQIETCMAKYCGYTEEDVFRSYGMTEYEIVTIGQHLADRLADMGRTSTILDVGLYTDLYPYSPRDEVHDLPRVLMYAALADYKGADDLPRIAEGVRERLAGRVSICSFHRDTPPPAWSDEHFQPGSTGEVASIYAAHDVYIYASLSDGFAMTPVEAMSCGTPVVLTDFPGKDQYARHKENCLIAGFRDANAVAEHVAKLLDDADLRAHLRSNGRKTALYYDWRPVGAQYIRCVLSART